MSTMTAVPATPVATIAEYLSGINEDDVIGTVLCYTISAGGVTHDDISRWFLELGLDPAHLPNKNSPVDAFRTATTDSKVDYVMDDGRSATLLIEEADSTSDIVYRKIVRRVRDRKRHELDYDPNVGEVNFYHRTGAAKFTFRADRVVGPVEEQVLRQLIADAQQLFEERKKFLNHAKLSRLVRDYLKALNAVSLRPSGGIYYVHKSRQRTVDSLHELVERFGDGSTIIAIPLPDTAYNREKILARLDEDMTAEIDALLEAISAASSAKQSGKVNPRTTNALHTAILGVQSRLAEHARTLDAQDLRARSVLTMATSQLMAVMA